VLRRPPDALGQYSLTPNSGRCLLVYLCASLYAVMLAAPCHFSLVISIGGAPDE
jgi:hypothetical protein